MSIQNISIYSDKWNGQGDSGKQFGSAYLNIGKKGQVVQGTILKNGDDISISFNGIEVAVARGAVKNAKEGEVRSFQITDVSKDSIVLREVDTKQQAEPVRGMVNTSVGTSGYSFAECLEASKETAQAKSQAGENLAILNGEDYERIEEEEGSLMEATKECVERAAQRSRERREWVENRMQEGAMLREEMQEGLEKMQAAGFLSQKSEARIRQALQDAGIPVTDDIVGKVMTALHMSESALDITDQSKIYIVGQDLAPTIENLYQGKYSMSTPPASGGLQQDFGEYQEQIEKILAGCGKLDDTGIQNAKWLFANELPVNEGTLAKLEMLNGISGRMTMDKVLEQIVFAVSAGSSPRDAVLDDSQFVVAKDVLRDFQNIEDSTILHVADILLQNGAKNPLDGNGEGAQQGDSDSRDSSAVTLEMLRKVQEMEDTVSSYSKDVVIPKVYTSNMGESDILKVTLKRQLEEIRQKMTLQSAAAMERKGIHIETEPLDNIIKALREMENAYYSSQVGEGAEIDSGALDLLQESLRKTADIADAHAALLGSKVRQQELLTVNELHAAANSRNVGRSEWNSVYETVSTQVRADLGDSIQKAFAGVPSILEQMGLEDTEANERAVRILGYNRMEITEENLEEIKMFDAKVNQVIENMKPSAVLELIRRGGKPLDTPLDELNRELEEINQEKGINSEERYSRFLWQMEKAGQISEEERMGYIGVYRLLNQVQKTDGAAIGAVIGTGQELTLGNLLTQVRTRKGKGIDSKVDDVTGVKQAKTMQNSITDQIHAGFTGETGKQVQEKSYYSHLASEALSELTPSKLQEITDGDMEKLLNVSLEKFYEDLKQASGNPDVKREYFDEQAKQLREALTSSEEVEEYLSKLGIKTTVENIMAAGVMLKEGYRPYKDGYERQNILSEERQKELQETFEEVSDSIGDEEALNARLGEAEKFMEEILTKSYEQADISFEDLSKLRKLGRGIHLEGMLRQSRSYDIPILAGDKITSLNLTIIHGADESGKIQISMEDEKFGNISVDLKVSDRNIKGLVLCDQRQGYEALQERGAALEHDLENAGYFVKNISYGMDFRSRNELLNGTAGHQGADTSQLYQISKILVRSVAAVISE
jgi:hypothetical protein